MTTASNLLEGFRIAQETGKVTGTLSEMVVTTTTGDEEDLVVEEIDGMIEA